MTNKEVAEAFLRRASASTANLNSIGTKLFSYQTCIAQWKGEVLIGNGTHYSPTTRGKHLYHIKDKVKKWTTKNVPQGTEDLLNYL